MSSKSPERAETRERRECRSAGRGDAGSRVLAHLRRAGADGARWREAFFRPTKRGAGMIRFCSRQTAENTVFGNDCIVISVTDPGKEPASIRGNPVDILRLEFHDCDEKDIHLKAMTAEQAKAIITFVEANVNNNIVIHCEAGICRSAGVALALAVWLETEAIGIDFPSVSLANAHVKSLILRELWRKA